MYQKTQLPRLLIYSLTVLVAVIAGCSKKSPHKEVEKKFRNKAVFQCARQKVITAAFSDDSVSLQLSDGRNLRLARARSASGARYTNTDESLVFWNKGNTAFITEDDSMTYQKCVVKGQQDLTNLKAYQSSRDSLVFRYPKSLIIAHKEVADTSGWSYASSATGNLIIQMKAKKSFQAKTNLSEATFSVGWSSDEQALMNCMNKPEGFVNKSDTITKDGVTYHRTRYGDAGAGNFYDIMQYRTKRGGRCYSLEEMVHSTNIHNYPKERGISAFDSTAVWKSLAVPFITFSFTND